MPRRLILAMRRGPLGLVRGLHWDTGGVKRTRIVLLRSRRWFVRPLLRHMVLRGLLFPCACLMRRGMFPLGCFSGNRLRRRLGGWRLVMPGCLVVLAPFLWLGLHRWQMHLGRRRRGLRRDFPILSRSMLRGLRRRLMGGRLVRGRLIGGWL